MEHRHRLRGEDVRRVAQEPRQVGIERQLVDRVAELVQQGEHCEEKGERHTELPALHVDDEQQEQEEAGAHPHGEPADGEGRVAEHVESLWR